MSRISALARVNTVFGWASVLLVSMILDFLTIRGLREGRCCGQQREDRENDSPVHPVPQKANLGAPRSSAVDVGKHIARTRDVQADYFTAMIEICSTVGQRPFASASRFPGVSCCTVVRAGGTLSKYSP